MTRPVLQIVTGAHDTWVEALAPSKVSGGFGPRGDADLPAPPRVLLVAPASRPFPLARDLAGRGFDVAGATSAVACIEQLAETSVNAVIIDLALGHDQALRLCEIIKQQEGPAVPVFLLVPIDASERVIVAALTAGAHDVISTTATGGLVAAKLRVAVRTYRELERLHQLAYRDALTGAFTRGYFNLTRRTIMKQVARSHRPVVSALFVDADHFKHVNDVHGHAAGDRVLHSLAGTLRECVREVDPVVRMGGEEFLVLLPQCGLRDAGVVAERIRSQVCREHMSQLGVTVSIGIATFDYDQVENPPEAEEVARRLVHAADLAMLEAKRTGRNRVCSSGLVR